MKINLAVSALPTPRKARQHFFPRENLAFDFGLHGSKKGECSRPKLYKTSDWKAVLG
jgi:hypothetical protein